MRFPDEDHLPGLGRYPSTFDPRDFNLRYFIPRGAVAEITPKTEVDWEYPAEPLDQESTGHCVGFTIANFGINLPTYTPYGNSDGHRFYYKCKVLDGDPNGEDGTTMRSGAKVMQDIGMVPNYAFAMDMNSILYWLLHKGPLVVGTIWTYDMFVPGIGNIIRPTGGIAGGHAYLLKGIRDDKVKIHSSWGPDWGENGAVYMSILDWEKLFMYDGEAIAAVELENHYVKEKGGCLLTNLFKKVPSQPLMPRR